MKHKLLPLIIASISTSALPALADSPTIYGKANLSLNSVELETTTPTTDQWELVSNASRIGVKGSMDINDNLKAIYKMEYEIYIDDGKGSSSKGSDTFEQRNIYVGVQGDWGTIIGGKHDTPLKLSQGKIDRFNDLQEGDIKNVLAGENRASNIVMYTTPKMNGFAATVAIIPGEGSDAAGNANNPVDNDGLSDGTSISVTYTDDKFYAALANDTSVEGWDLTRLTGEVTLGDAKIGLIYQDGEAAASSVDVEQDGYILSAQYTIDKIVLKAQYGSSTTEFGASELDTTQKAVGIDYKLNKKTKVFSYYSVVESDLSSLSAPEDSVFGLGMELKF